MDPYLKVQLGSQVVKCKTHDEGGKTPNWKNEVITLNNVDCIIGDKMTFYVMEEDVFKDDEIGKIEIPVDKYFSGQKIKESLKVFHDGKDAGTINFEI